MSEVTLFCGDCLGYMQTMPDKSVDAVITDLPYGTTQCSWDEIIPLESMWEGVKRVLKPNGVFITTGSQPFTSKLIMSNYKDFRYELIWNKSYSTGFLDANRKPLKAHENILVFFGTDTYNPQMSIGKLHRRGSPPNKPYSKTDVYGSMLNRKITYSDLFYPNSIITTEQRENTHYHPTQKPVKLFEYLIKTYTNENDTVLDICAGSGTTGVACVQTSRNFIGCEIDSGYFEIAKKRIETAQLQIRMEI